MLSFGGLRAEAGKGKLDGLVGDLIKRLCECDSMKLLQRLLCNLPEPRVLLGRLSVHGTLDELVKRILQESAEDGFSTLVEALRRSVPNLVKKFLSNGGEFDEVTNRLLNFLLVNHEVYDLAKLLEIEPELKEELLTGKLSVAMNKYLGTLLENGYVWGLRK